MSSPGTAVERYRGGTPLASAEHWVDLTEHERLHRALAACQARDAEALWSLTLAHIATFGRAGAAVSPHTVRDYRLGVRRLLADWRTEDLRKPRRAAAALWLRRLEERGWARPDGTARPYKPQTVHLYFTAARHLYAALRWAGATAADPFADVRPAPDRTPAHEKRGPYSTAHVAALLGAAAAQDRVAILLCAHAGLRISEATDLAWADVALDAETLRVRRGKGGRARSVPLSASLGAQLRAWRAEAGDGGHVLPYRDRRTAWKRLKAVALRAGVPWLGVHALRHTAGTEIVRATGDLEIAARLLGHQQLETTRIYVQWSDDRLKDTLKGW